jgi:hypothetical protein
MYAHACTYMHNICTHIRIYAYVIESWPSWSCRLCSCMHTIKHWFTCTHRPCIHTIKNWFTYTHRPCIHTIQHWSICTQRPYGKWSSCLQCKDLNECLFCLVWTGRNRSYERWNRNEVCATRIPCMYVRICVCMYKSGLGETAPTSAGIEMRCVQTRIPCMYVRICVCKCRRICVNPCWNCLFFALRDRILQLSHA